ncbi:PKD domain-containing protein [Maribacter sp. HTCC2170]|uniref:PKD domain-containing protein n=1 Tax=Maribacter sp. (strain HTCC2170 / KCCM 42371) TaxID=313603 RepID=UPI00006B226D|nr:PKD domain-containing protein [Maribacter sp. HTCC2170]EAR00257.1 hypothetical protein FB2170_12586 [Maribacter sp. HTCC2170]
MKKQYPKHLPLYIIGLFLCLLTGSISNLNAQISFTKSNLDLNGEFSFELGTTSIMFGPDGRFYLSEYPSGTIRILTIQRSAANNYIVTDVETLSGITDIVNRNDDGTTNTGETYRETTGLTVSGTAANPIIYVTSSDPRIGAGFSEGDVDLDTNSGIVTRMTWNGGAWDVVDLVRGLPRSEENHATNGLEIVNINGSDYLIIANGGHTNGGAPSQNFTYVCEYALSGAVLSVNLTALNGMTINTDGNGRKYIYDLPTVDDPTRANANGITDPDTPGYDGIDVNDPFGGNDGLNQAVVVPGGPVQIVSPGYRNAYDLVVTESGALYVTDNGANGNWGGFPVNEGTGAVTNDYDPTEPGSTSPSGGEQINNEDHLQLVTTDLQNYTFGSYYGGHPNPIRANPNGAGLYTAPQQFGTVGAVFRTMKYDPDGSTPGSTTDPNIALPANWPPVASANIDEGDWRGPGETNPDGPDDNAVTIWTTNTNGIDEYTASNFSNAMKGDLIAGENHGLIKRVILNPNGSLNQLIDPFETGIGGDALGITCNSDIDNFPGTIWAGTLNGKIVIFEPSDYNSNTCLTPGDPGYDANADYDGDGYTNQDEEDNGTDACNGASQPNDFDMSVGGVLVSDLNDSDDDADGIIDANDPFQLGNPNTSGSDAFILPISNDLFNTQVSLGGYDNLGLTGLMNNGDPNPNWLDWLDDSGQGPNPDDILGGASGLMVIQMTSGTAMGVNNNQEKAFQYGIQADQNIGNFTVIGNLLDLSTSLGLYGNSSVIGGELGYFIGDGTQSNYIKMVLTTNGLTILQEINDNPQTPINVPIAIQDRPTTDIVLYFVIDPSNGEIEFEYAIDGGSRVLAGTLTAQGSILTAIQQSNSDLAVGIIGTSNTSGVELEGTFDYLNVILENNSTAIRINSGGPQVVHDGNIFNADQHYVGGQSYVNGNAQVPELFQSEHTSSSLTFDYQIPVQNGDYTVILHFAEIYWGATGGGSGATGIRVFDVSLEGSLVLDDYDIYDDVGAETEVSKSFDITVLDGSVDIYFSALTSTGGANQPKISAIEVIGNANEAPVAVGSSSPSSGDIPLAVSFTGSNSTDDVQVVSYTWDFKDGTPISTLANPTHTFTTAGTYIVELTVEDGEGLTDSTIISIEANTPINEPPVAVATANPLSGNVPLQVSFMGSNSTDDTAVTGYLWDFKDGSSTSAEINPIHTFTTEGTYIVELTVEDVEGLNDATTVTIEVNMPPNEAPVAVASAIPTNGTIPLEVTFTGSNSTDDVAVTAYLWDFKDGTATSTTMNPVHMFSNGGTYIVELTVEDEESLTDTTTITIIASTPSNEAPVAVVSASPISGTIPLEVTFSGSNSTDDVEIVSYIWDFNDGSSTSDLANPIHTFVQAGSYLVELSVTDAEGLSNSSTITIVVSESTVDTNELNGLLIINPAKDVAQVLLIDNGEVSKIVNKVYLHDSSGRLIGLYNPRDIFAHGLYEIPISSLNSGSVYFIGFEMNGGEKIVLELIVKN